jgi:probable O-glycosylation ligase (exosortase A-associated)
MPSLGLAFLMCSALLLSAVGFPFGTLLMFVWWDHVSPHSALYGPFADLPWALYMGLFALVSWVFSQKNKFEMLNVTTFFIVLYAIWICVTTVNALEPEVAYWKWDRTIKILFSSLLITMMLSTKERVAALIWTLVISVGVYIARGALRTIATGGGGGELVLGVEGSFIGERNTFAATSAGVLALIFALIKHPILLPQTKLVKACLWITFCLGVIAIIGTQSRSGLLALAALLASLVWFFSKHRIMVLGIVAAISITVAPLISSNIGERLETVKSYEQDGSAMGRINAWNFGLAVVANRPILGGGFKIYTRNIVDPEKSKTEYLDAHSFFFEILAEHGIPGISIWLSLWFSSLWLAWRNVKRLKPLTSESAMWISTYLKALSAALIAFTVGAAFNALGQYPFFFLMFGSIGSLSVMAKRLIDKTNATNKPRKGVNIQNALLSPNGKTL